METGTDPDWNGLQGCKSRLEPSIHEVMSDPIIHAVMRRDGVTTAELWQVIEAVRRRAVSTHHANQRDANCAADGRVRLQMSEDDTSRPGSISDHSCVNCDVAHKPYQQELPSVGLTNRRQS